MKEDDEKISSKDLIREVKSVYAGLVKNRYKTRSTGYTFDRWMFQAVMLLCFFWLWFVAQSYNYDLDYYECNNPLGTAEFYMGEVEEVIQAQGPGCKNPFYDSGSSWKSMEYLSPGTYGTKPGHLFWSIEYVPVLLLGLAFLLNHLIHNRKARNEMKQK